MHDPETMLMIQFQLLTGVLTNDRRTPRSTPDPATLAQPLPHSYNLARASNRPLSTRSEVQRARPSYCHRSLFSFAVGDAP